MTASTRLMVPVRYMDGKNKWNSTCEASVVLSGLGMLDERRVLKIPLTLTITLFLNKYVRNIEETIDDVDPGQLPRTVVVATHIFRLDTKYYKITKIDKKTISLTITNGLEDIEGAGNAVTSSGTLGNRAAEVVIECDEKPDRGFLRVAAKYSGAKLGFN